MTAEIKTPISKWAYLLLLFWVIIGVGIFLIPFNKVSVPGWEWENSPILEWAIRMIVVLAVLGGIKDTWAWIRSN